MPKKISVFFVGIGIITFGVAFCQQFEKIIDMFFVNEIAVVVGAEKFFKIESFIFVEEVGVIQKCAEIVSKNIQLRQFGIGVRVAAVIFIPISFCLLFVDIIPSKSFFRVVIFDDIKRRAGKCKKLCIFADKIVNDGFAERGSSAFVRLVHNYKIPICAENFKIFIEFAADGIRAAQVLN